MFKVKIIEYKNIALFNGYEFDNSTASKDKIIGFSSQT